MCHSGSTILYSLEEGWEYEVVHRLLSIKQGYHHIHVKSKDIPNIAFRTCYVHYKYMVMSFGVTNVPGVFMDYMNRIFHPYLDSFIVG
ncbi:Retrovirus-related Pol polyprotein from transposon opus, partial [Mucuna pruriens]